MKSRKDGFDGRFLLTLALLAACSQVGSVPITPVTTPDPVGVTDPSAPTKPAVVGALGSWSNPATWGGNSPTASSSVTIAAGQTVTLDADVNVKNLTVYGNLVCAERDLKLTANWIMVHAPGRLECGTASKPFTKRLVVTLNASDASENVMGMGTKFLGAMGGVIDLHGESRTSWTKLSATAELGATQINVIEASNWRVGDRIVIAPTDFQPLEAEERTVKAISGTTITLDAPLEYRHWGKVQTLGATGETMDERAEVALLSRNITIRGDNLPGSSFGAHTMYMTGSTVRMRGVEITGMGQLGTLGRYPWHAHLLGDGGAGSYLTDSSLHSNLQRGIVVHRSNNLVFKNNVVYNTVGHMVFLESSTEQGNTFENNLLLLTRPVPLASMNPTIAFDHAADPLGDFSRVSGFWISNQNNRFVGNHVAGILNGHGYWFVEGAALINSRDYDLRAYRPNGEAKPPYQGALTFDGNVAHTIRPALEYGGSNPMRVAGNGVMLDGVYFGSGDVTIRNTRVWKVSMYAVWGLFGDLAAPVVTGLVTADAKSAIFNGEHNGLMRVNNSVLYGMTDNQPPNITARSRDWPALWKSFGHFPDDLSIEPVSTYPDTFEVPTQDGIAPESVMTANGSVTGTPVFSEFSRVTLGGWR